MLAFVSKFFLYKNIARLLLRSFADNRHKYKANFRWWFPTNLRVFIVREANYSDSKDSKDLIARSHMKKETTIYVLYFYEYCALLDICR